MICVKKKNFDPILTVRVGSQENSRRLGYASEIIGFNCALFGRPLHRVFVGQYGTGHCRAVVSAPSD